MPSVTGDPYTPRQGVSGQTVTLKNSSGQTVATGTGSNPATITATVTAGAYTLETTPTSGAGTASTTIATPDYPNIYQVDYDSRDHPTVIRDGQTTTTETLSPTGRVLRRTVTNAATNTTLEDTLYGYNAGGDRPAYTRPYGGGTVTTYLPGVTYTGLTATWQHTNRNGDITATTDQAGTWTPNPPTDEYGIGTTPATRLGWLGSHQRFTTNPRLGTIRMGVRLYDPTLGRFTSTDPVEGGCANAYTYVFGDPINQKDLDGRFTFCAGVAFFSWFSFLGDASSKGIGEGAKNQAISNGSTAVTKAALQRAAARSTGFMRGVFTRAARLVGKSSSLGVQGVLGVLYAGCTAELNYRNSKRWREGQTADVPSPQNFNGSGIPMCNGGRCFP